MKLVIVESPTKAKTISRFLEKEYRVLSSYGHVRDLPVDRLGVDVQKDFTPEYIVPEKAQKNVAILEKESAKAKSVILATDEDREGEAIACHLKKLLAQKKKGLRFERITFHEITPRAIKEALAKPRDIDVKLFDAQQARRVLDRLVGYELSPFLWRKIRKGLSAGRVQSVAVRLIVERERERENFKSEEFWKVRVLWGKKTQSLKNTSSEIKIIKSDGQAVLSSPKKMINGEYLATLAKINDKKLDKLYLKKEAEVRKIVTELAKNKMLVAKIEQKKSFRTPPPPFRTSTLQQEAGRRLGFPAKKTMRVAQQLYEGIKLNGKRRGLITYMRTDSLNLSTLALAGIQKYVREKFGEKYALSSFRFYTKKAKGAQEAHEAIRPTYVDKDPELIKNYLTDEQYKLYRIIWERTVACQMATAELNNTNVIFTADKYELVSKGVQIIFDGFFKVLGQGSIKEETLPELKENEEVTKKKILGEQNFTQPPARYTEATLVKALEENGIGRPSTYAPTISTIQTRGYVAKDEKYSLYPEEIGYLVNDILVKHFPRIVEIPFTARVEEDLDEIARGRKKWVPIIREFYIPFKQNLEKKIKEVKKVQKFTDKKCPECGKRLVEKFGRFGKFYACSGFPACKYTEANEEEKKLQKIANHEKCPECGAPLVLRHGKFGKFMGCSKYPECKFIKKFEKKTGVKCPECKKGDLVERRGRHGPFYACNRYPGCKYIAKGDILKKIKSNA
ncbi:MAG: type I DNA topoisomerase [Candidatus Moranbacteria bacterium]|nr:type I DNA topoisomerase [Candidatus Moranbacteria bacterium]